MTILFGPTPVFATATGLAFHDTHAGVRPARRFQSARDALAAGLRPCRICRPVVPKESS